MFRTISPFGLFPLLCLACLVVGCATTAKKIPTPADDVRLEDLDRLPTPADERYYGMIFGSQSPLKRAKYSHTWATVVRVKESPSGKPLSIEPFTISWLPATGNIRPLRFRVEPGKNFGLHETIKNMLAHNERVSIWGPFEIRSGLFIKFLMQKQYLETGAVGYQCIDTIGEAARTGKGCDCIHAITDADSTHGRVTYPLFRYGESASRHVVEQLLKHNAFMNPQIKHEWLISALDLKKYPIFLQPTPTQ